MLYAPRLRLTSTFALLVATACVSVDHATKTDPGDSVGGTGSSVGGRGSGGKGSGTGSRAGNAGGAGNANHGGDAGPPPTNSAPEVTIDAHATGRGGDDLTFTVAGTDAEGDVLFLAVRFQDASGQPVNVFDSHWDGLFDTAEDRLQFDSSLDGQDRFTGTVTLRGFATKFADAVKVVVHVEDAAGNSSGEQTLDIGTQEVRRSGDSCDPSIIADRCDPGLSCGGDPSACQAGTAPEVQQISYLRAPEGPILLVDGLDADDDIATFHLELQSASGSPVKVDVDGDQIVDSSTWDLDAYGASSQGAFLFKNQFGLAFDSTAPKMLVTAIDGEGNKAEQKPLRIAAAPLKAHGASCDPRGFDTCPSADTCAPGIVGLENACNATTDTRAEHCRVGPELDPAAGVSTTFGRTQGSSVWDPPVGCSSPVAVRRPEAAVRLHLRVPAAHLKVTTALPETRFDTILYLLPACAPTPKNGVPCNDDTDGYTSTLTADDVAAGDYIIIVDSRPEAGGPFGLTVTVE
jgi:hypothetical protein